MEIGNTAIVHSDWPKMPCTSHYCLVVLRCCAALCAVVCASTGGTLNVCGMLACALCRGPSGGEASREGVRDLHRDAQRALHGGGQLIAQSVSQVIPG